MSESERLGERHRTYPWGREDGELVEAFRDWASLKTDLTPRDAVLILHFACRRARLGDPEPLRARSAMALIQAVGARVLAKGGAAE